MRAPGIGPARCGRLLAQYGDAASVVRAPAPELARFGVPAAALDYLQHPDSKAIAADLAWLAQPGHQLLTVADSGYPPQLRAIDALPTALFVQGDAGLLAEPQLAIVGSRNPSPAGRDNAHQLAAELAAAGLVITSGLALGIDAAAHRGALSVEGATVAVMGTGPDRIYPARHRELAHAIAGHGALVTEFPPGSPAQAEHFPRRNRVISGLSLGTLVVEAAQASGSLITARFAAEQGREVLAVPGSIRNPLSRGCHQLIRDGARLVESSRDILEELRLTLAAAIKPPPEPPAAADVPLGAATAGLDAEHQQVLAELGTEPTAVDTLVERTGLTADVVSSILLILELHGFVTSQPGGHYSRAFAEAR